MLASRIPPIKHVLVALLVGSSLFVALFLTALDIHFRPRTYQTTWPRVARPQSVGFDPIRLAKAKDVAERSGAAAVVVIADGKLLAAWGDPARPYPVHSVRKSLLNALYGQAVERGEISLATTLEELGIDDLPPLTAQEKSATIGDLITSRSGVYHKSNKASKEMLANLPRRDADKPGERWLYQNWPFNALATIYQKQTHRDVFEAFEEEIAVPLGFEHFDRSRHTVWESDGYSMHPAYDFRLSALDLARFGQMYLQNGTWNGHQIVPEAWIRMSTAKHSYLAMGPHGPIESESDDDTPGYGYLWWIETIYFGTDKRTELVGSFSAEGMGGHMLLVAPAVNAVIVIRANTWLPAWTPLQTTRLRSASIRRVIEAIMDARLIPEPPAQSDPIRHEGRSRGGGTR